MRLLIVVDDAEAGTRRARGWLSGSPPPYLLPDKHTGQVARL